MRTQTSKSEAYMRRELSSKSTGVFVPWVAIGNLQVVSDIAFSQAIAATQTRLA
jgi:hypothetical protein